MFSIKENTIELEAAIDKAAPDVLLMDMLLSGSDGREICRRLKSNPGYAKIPLIMISAHPQARTECLEAGADLFLAKPFEMTDLFDTVTAALAKVGK